MAENYELEKYRGKRVLITGDTGFKGSWLALWLSKLGADIVGYSLPAVRKKDHFELLCLKNEIRHIDGDIRDYDSLLSIFQEFKPEFVFHLAAQALVRESYLNPRENYEVNVQGSVNLLEAVRHTSSVRSLIFVTSDKCYKNKEWVWGYRENDELGGFDPYSASKAAAEVVFSSYMDSYFKVQDDIGVASVRAGNVIGGGDWSNNRIVPDCVAAIEQKKPIVLRNPNSTRPWQHVLEPLYGYLLLGLKLSENSSLFSGSWNFGPNSNSILSVGTLAKEFVSSWKEGEIVLASEIGPHEANILHLNCEKAAQLLHWRPIMDFKETVAKTVEWYKAVSDGENVYELSVAQIKHYSNQLLEVFHD